MLVYGSVQFVLRTTTAAAAVAVAAVAVAAAVVADAAAALTHSVLANVLCCPLHSLMLHCTCGWLLHRSPLLVLSIVCGAAEPGAQPACPLHVRAQYVVSMCLWKKEERRRSTNRKKSRFLRLAAKKRQKAAFCISLPGPDMT
jgi:hypothetical protein